MSSARWRRSRFPSRPRTLTSSPKTPSVSQRAFAGAVGGPILSGFGLVTIRWRRCGSGSGSTEPGGGGSDRIKPPNLDRAGGEDLLEPRIREDRGGRVLPHRAAIEEDVADPEPRRDLRGPATLAGAEEVFHRLLALLRVVVEVHQVRRPPVRDP